METGEKQLPKHLKQYVWKKGQSGNPNGRPKGKTLKEFAREYLESLPDDEKLEYLETLPTELVWKMAEGNPANNTDITSGGKPLILPAELINKNDTPSSTDISSEGQTQI